MTDKKLPIKVAYSDRGFDPLGEVISGVWINGDKTAIKFTFTDGTDAYLYTEGDCCSETWIEHINDFEYAVGMEITSTETTCLGEAIPTRQECDQLYAASVNGTRTNYPNHVRLDIEFRNSSNGYYGGDINWCLKPNSDDEWVEIKEDF